jgi:hypothetical protein
MSRGGDQQAGYEVESEPGALVRIRVWGHWDLPLAESYSEALRMAFEPLRGRPFVVLSDGRGSPIQSEAVATVRLGLMKLATEWGMTRVAFVVSTTLAKLRLKHLARESGVREWEAFTDEAEARAWLARPYEEAG